ncbi:polymorphic toxin type 27 domain-containing protein [Streptomyces uncialis]|uniref:polymorphic toxin type 27 domain-containing protein n=1 Tax=Streptomyces uncialis TaxID=1048205 RepID=UPI0009A0D648|nr:polymorphic toxin type 27 domain-containing protein [Streptomyces uncialis]
MTLLTDDADTVIVTANREYTRHARTYNLTVEDLHSYCVLAGDTPVLVHNSGGCPTDVALGLRKNGLRGFADGKGYTHYLDSDIWEVEVRSAAHNPNVRLHVSLDGFRGANPGEQFSSAYKSGSGSNWFATEREMYHVGKAVRVGDRSWDSVTFY